MTDLEVIAEAKELARWRQSFGPRLDQKQARLKELHILKRAASLLLPEFATVARILEIVSAEMGILTKELGVLQSQDKVWRDQDIALFHNHVIKDDALAERVRGALAAEGLPHV